MGGEQAANVLITVKEDQLHVQGKTLSGEEREKMLQTILKNTKMRGLLITVPQGFGMTHHRSDRYPEDPGIGHCHLTEPEI